MGSGQRITVQRLMDRYREAASDLFEHHFDDPFIADRFLWVSDTMFLVMVLNYFNLSEKKLVYPEIKLHPAPAAKACVQANGQIVELAETDVLHFRYLINENAADPPLDWKGNWVLARAAECSDPQMRGADMVLDYTDCSFIGTVEADDP